MAKRSKPTKRLRSPPQRDIINPIARRSLLGRSLIRSQSQMLLDIARITGQDQRTYNPISKTIRPARQVSGLISTQTVKKNTPLKTAKFSFVLPKETTVCVRRGVRKEVLFALQKTRSGSRAKNRKFNSNSRVKC